MKIHQEQWGDFVHMRTCYVCARAAPNAEGVIPICGRCRGLYEMYGNVGTGEVPHDAAPDSAAPELPPEPVTAPGW